MSIKVVESITNPMLSMKMVNRNTLSVTNTSASLVTANSVYMIHMCLTPNISTFDGIHEVRLRFRQSGSTQAAAYIYLSTDSYINQSTYKPLNYVVEGSVTYREVDIKEFFGSSTEPKYLSIICNQELKLYTSSASIGYEPELRLCKIEENDLIKNQLFLDGGIKEDRYSVNIRSGKMYYDKELLSVMTPNSSIDLSMSYNISNNDTTLLKTSVISGLGKGFKFNYQQVLFQNGNDYIYIDGSYKKHVFKLANNLSSSSSTKVYYDQSGNFAYMKVLSSGYEIKQENTTLTFNSTGLLTSIKVRKTTSLTLTTTLTYDTSGRLIKITCDSKYININYTSTLVTITSSDGRVVKISINSDSLISSITDEINKVEYYEYLTIDAASGFSARAVIPPVSFNEYILNTIRYGNYKVKFNYSNKKVTKIENYYSSYISKKEELTYKGNITNVKTTKYVNTTGLEIVNEYHFDDYGFIKTSYEIINDSVCSLKHYNISDEKQELMDFNCGEERYISDFISSSSTNTNICFDSLPVGDYILNIGCKITGSESNNLNSGVLKGTVHINQSQSGTLVFDPTVDGYQFLTMPIKITQEVNSLALYVPITNTISNRTVKFTSIVLTPKPSQKTELCHNIIRNSTTYVEQIDGVKYGKDYISAITYNDGATKTVSTLKMSLEDIRQTERSYYRDSNKLVWYNNGENMLYNCSSVSLSTGYASLTIPNIKYGLLKHQVLKDTSGQNVEEYQFQKVQMTSSNTIMDEMVLVKQGTSYSNLIKNRTSYDQFNNFLSKLEVLPTTSTPYKKEVILNSGTGRVDEELESKGSTNISVKYSYDSLGFVSSVNDEYLKVDYTNNILGNPTGITKNNQYEYGYSYFGDLKTLSYMGYSPNTNTINYNSSDDVEVYKTQNTQYKFELDVYGQLDKVKLLNSNGSVISTLLDYSYSVSGGNVVLTVTDSKGDTKTFTCDKYGKILSIKEGTTQVLLCEYYERSGINSQAARLRKKTIKGRIINYYYDMFGNVRGISNDLYGHTVSKANIQYDTTVTNNVGYNYSVLTDMGVQAEHKEIVTSKKEEYGTATSKYLIYECDRHGNHVMNDNIIVDDFGRVTDQTVNMDNVSCDKVYEYLGVPSSTYKTTRYIGKETIKKNNVNILQNSYEYDRGMVCKKTNINGDVEEYTYDNLCRITTYKKNNSVIKSYTYDNDGNIFVSGTNPTYQNQLLKVFNGKTLTYSGRYLSTYGNINFSFTNGRLVSYNGNGNTITFEYDGDSNRYSKTVNGVTTYYYYEGNRLLKETKGSTHCIEYLYGVNGMVGFIYNSKTYTYIRNMFNDVEAIVDNTGAIVARYSYDPFGNTVINLNTDNIAVINPIRYRGYYYDVETQLYWVSSRYYSPELCRWISPDSIEYLDPESINGLNLYAYCGNNPVNYFDPDGHMPLLVIALIAGVISAGANVLSQVVFDDKSFSEIHWGKVGISFASGFLSGLIPGSGVLSLIGQAAVSSVVENGLLSIAYGEEFTIGEVAKDFGLQLGTGLLLKGIGNVTSKVTNKLFIKANGYAQYQHYFRSKGLNYTRDVVYKHMYRHVKGMTITNEIVDNLFDFGLNFITSPF